MARVKTGFCIYLLHENPLGLAARRHDAALRTTILIDTRTDDNAMNGIAVGKSLVEELEDDGGNAFTAGVAVATCVESIAVSIGVDHSVVWMIIVR